MNIMDTFLSHAAILLLLVAGAPGESHYRHFSLLNKEAASTSNRMIDKTIDFTWDSFSDPTNWTQVVESGLILEYERMQSFISATRFDVARFDSAVQEICRAFTGLMSIARVSIFSNDQLYRQFGYCIRVFDEMVGATQILMAQDPSEATFDTLIANIVDLYIRLLSMYNVQETLDRRISHLYESIQDFHDKFNTWTKDFWSLSDIPPEKRVLFQEYSTKIEKKIKDVIGQFSRCMSECEQIDSV